jgi:hypothetical protein
MGAYAKAAWYGVIAVAPLYSAYQGLQSGDLWTGLIGGLIVAGVLLAMTQAVAFALRKLRRRTPSAR